MLVVYTSQDTVDCEVGSPVEVTEARLSVAWCREMVVAKIHHLATNRGIEGFSVYGIIDGEGSYLPSGIRSSIIGTHSPVVGILVPLLFHTVLELASGIFLGTEFQWERWWRAWRLRAGNTYPTEGTTPYTIDVDNPEGAGHGSITNLPAWVGRSIPLTSFLLYLPRIWYNLTLSGYTCDHVNRRKVYTAQEKVLLSGIAAYLAAPLYHMPHGRASFWSFLDFLATAAASPEYSVEAQDLLTDADCSGYVRWVNNLGAQKDLPPWCEGVLDRYKLYRRYGPYVLTLPGTIKKAL